MKSPYKYKIRNSLLACGSLLAATNANAQLQWDSNNTGAGQTDGAGTWLNANQWWDGAANVNWNSATPDNAIIGNGGAGGAISLGGNVTAGTIGLSNFTGTYTIQGVSQTLTQSGGITIGGAGNVTFRGTSNTAGQQLNLSGAGGITMNGTGILTMRENIVTNYTGQTTINNGVVLLNGGSKSTGNFNLNGGMLTDYFQGTGVFTSGLGAGTNQIQIYGSSGFGAGNGTSTWRIGAAGSTLTWGTLGENSNINATGFFNPTELRLRASQADNNGPSIYGTPVLDNRLDLNGGTRTINVFQGTGASTASRATMNAGITGTGASSSLIKEGGGMLILGGSTSNYGGTTTVNAGILDFGATNIANLGGGSGRNITVAANSGVKFNALSNAILNRIVETTGEIGIMSNTTANNFDFSSSVTGANLANAFLGNFATNGAKAEFSGTITPGSNGYKFGAIGSSGNMGIRGAMTGNNTLTVGQTGASGVRVTLAGAKDFTGQTVINSGARLTLGDNLALQNSALNVGSAGGNIAFNGGTAAATITGNTVASSPTFGGLIGSRNLSSVFTTAGGNNESNLTANNVTGFTLNVGTGNTFTYSGAIGGFGTGTSNNAGGGINGNSTLTKSGAGTQVLNGTNTYTGATTISEGGLVINGAVASTSVVVNGSLGGSGVMANATLSGSGSINPGNSPGIMTAAATDPTGGLDYNFEFTAANTAPTWNNAAASVNDVLRLTSATPFSAALDASNILSVYFNVGSLSVGDVFTGGFYTNNSADFLSTISGATFQYFLADGLGTETYGGNTYSAYTGGIDVTTAAQTANFGSGNVNGYTTQFTVAVPEPSVVTLLGALGGMLLLRRRR